MENIKQRFIRTPFETPLRWLRLAAKIPWRLRHPELNEVYIEPIRVERALVKMLRPDSNVIDVGAHLGGILSSVLKRAPNGKHIAFEPTPRKADWLRDKFPEVEIVQIAVSDHVGSVSFFEVSKKTAFSGLRTPDGTKEDTVEFSVSCRPLDDCIPLDYVPDVLKVDVIGAELLVLRGAQKIMERAHPIILFASGTANLAMFGTKPGELYDWIVERDYAIFFLKDYLRNDAPSDRDRFLSAHEYPYQAFDFIAKHITSTSGEQASQ